MRGSRSLPNGGSRCSHHEEGHHRDEHVRSEAGWSLRENLTWSKDRTADQKTLGAHPYSISHLTAATGKHLLALGTKGAPRIESAGETFAMGSDRFFVSSRSDGSQTRSTVESVHQPPTFIGVHVTVNHENIPEDSGHAISSSTSVRQLRPDQDEFGKAHDDADQRRRFRWREKEAALPKLRLRNLETRAQVDEARYELSEVRLEMETVDGEFMKLVREELIREPVRVVENSRAGNPLKRYEDGLKASFTKLQAARDKYGPLQDTYNVLEALLNQQEYEVAKLEQQMLKYDASGTEDLDDSDSFSSASEDSDLEDQQYLGELYPSYNQYMSRLGDASVLQEALDEIIFEQHRLKEQQEIWRRMGRDLLPQDQTMLASLPADEARIQGELYTVKTDLQRLRIQCIQEGLLDDRVEDDVEDGILGPSGLLLEEAEQDEALESTNESRSTSPAQSEYSRFHLLLEKPDDMTDREMSETLIKDFKIGDVGDRIECWLLHRLRSSCLEAQLLAHFAPSGFDIFQGTGLEPAEHLKTWQEAVLEFWFFDSTNRSPVAYMIHPTAMISPDDFTVKEDATVDTNTATIHPQSSSPSESLISTSQSSFHCEDSTHDAPQPEAIPLPPSPPPSAIPLPPSPPPFTINLVPFTFPEEFPPLHLSISTSATTSNLRSTMATISSPVSTLPSPLPPPLLLPTPTSSSPFSIAKDKNRDTNVGYMADRQGHELHRTVLPSSDPPNARDTNGANLPKDEEIQL